MGEGHRARARGLRNGYGPVSISGTCPAIRTGNREARGKRVRGPIPLSPDAARPHWASGSVPRGDTASYPTMTARLQSIPTAKESPTTE